MSKLFSQVKLLSEAPENEWNCHLKAIPSGDIIHLHAIIYSVNNTRSEWTRDVWGKAYKNMESLREDGEQLKIQREYLEERNLFALLSTSLLSYKLFARKMNGKTNLTRSFRWINARGCQKFLHPTLIFSYSHSGGIRNLISDWTWRKLS